MRIIITDDDALIRDSLKIILDLEDDMEVVGTAKDGKEAVSLVKDTEVDLVLMDIRMPVMDGVLATKKIKEIKPEVEIVILTTFKDEDYILEAIKNGAKGYILKNHPADSVIESLRTVMNGKAVFDDDVANQLKGLIKKSPKATKESFDLTKREFDIMENVAKGYTNKEIANELFLSEGTVRNYLSQILEKLMLRDRTQLAIFFLENFR